MCRARRSRFATGCATVALALGTAALPLHATEPPTAAPEAWLDWKSLPPLPDPIGIAGPLVGVHDGGLIVAGGANFGPDDAADLWQLPKRFHRAVHVLTRSVDGRLSWRTGFKLDRARAYGACASTPAGVVCAGGDDGTEVLADAFLLTWNAAAGALRQRPLPPLPAPRTAAGAAVVGGQVYVVGGQEGLGLGSATATAWRLDLACLGNADLVWEALPPVPGGPRAYPLVTVQHDGVGECLHVIGGRRQKPGRGDAAGIEPLADLHAFSPSRFATSAASAWRRRADSPVPLMAGAAIGMGRRHVVVLAADDGSLMARAVADPGFTRRHPGFPRCAWAYDTITDAWTSAGETPACPVTTPAVAFEDAVVLVSGEVRPRVRTTEAWRIAPVAGGALRDASADRR